MKNFISLLLLLTSLRSLANSDFALPEECQVACNEADKLILGSLVPVSENLLKGFVLNKKDVSEGEKFLQKQVKHTESIVKARNTLSDSCLKSYCENHPKELRYSSPEGIQVKLKNPLCDYPPSNKKVPIRFVGATLSVKDKSVAQVNFRLDELNLSVLFKPLTKNCSLNGGGNFDNRLIASNNSLVLTPENSSVNVGNTPTGVQVIRRKKIIPSLSYSDSAGLLKFNLGDNYRGTIDVGKFQIIEENILTARCSGAVNRNPQKGTSRISLSPSSVNSNGLRALATNQYRLIDSEIAKLRW